jgi:hypothetical protein
MKNPGNSNRRKFIQKTALLGAGIVTFPATGFGQAGMMNASDSIYLIGPREGYSPQIGTLLSTMTMMRTWLIESIKDLSVEQLDFQLDEQSNSIGAMLWHLAATEKYYQLNTFDELKWGSWSDEIKKEWDVASHLGEKARDLIKGNDAGFYIDKLDKVRAVTEKEFAKRDDTWIMKSEPFFDNLPTNNYCKWFHVCEHESNHRGQIKFILKRIPDSEE